MTDVGKNDILKHIYEVYTHPTVHLKLTTIEYMEQHSLCIHILDNPCLHTK